MTYKKLSYPFTSQPTSAQMLGDVILRAAERRQLRAVDLDQEFDLVELMNICRCLATPGAYPWPRYTPQIEGDGSDRDDAYMLGHGILFAAISLGLKKDEMVADSTMDFYRVPKLSELIELGRKIADHQIGYGLFDSPEIIASYDDIKSLAVEPVHDDGENCEVVDPADKEVSANLFSIYAVNSQGLSDVVGDFNNPADAFRYADEIARAAKDAGNSLSIRGRLRRWCLLDVLDCEESTSRALRSDYLTFSRSDKCVYVKPTLPGLVYHEAKIDGTCVSEWPAYVSAPGGNFHVPYPMIAIDAVTHDDQRQKGDVAREHAHDEDFGNLRTAIWIVNPEMRDQATKIARDLLHYGVASIDPAQAGLIVAVGDRHRIYEESTSENEKLCRFHISPLSADVGELSSEHLGALLDQVADAFSDKPSALGVSIVYENKWLAVGGVDVLPDEKGSHIALEFATRGTAFRQLGTSLGIETVLRGAADSARDGKEVFDLYDSMGTAIGKISRSDPKSVHAARSSSATFISEALQALKTGTKDGLLTARLVAQRAGYDAHPKRDVPISFEEFPALKESYEEGLQMAGQNKKNWGVTSDIGAQPNF